MQTQISAYKNGEMGIRFVDFTNIDFLVCYRIIFMYGITIEGTYAQEVSLLFYQLPMSISKLKV